MLVAIFNLSYEFKVARGKYGDSEYQKFVIDFVIIEPMTNFLKIRN
ncbi:hypothetical protein [Dapis sp. BLCC M172]